MGPCLNVSCSRVVSRLNTLVHFYFQFCSSLVVSGFALVFIYVLVIGWEWRDRKSSWRNVPSNGSSDFCAPDSWTPSADITLTNYNKDVIEPRDCKASACGLNRGRTPVEFYTSPKDSCRSVQECVTITIKTRHRYSAVQSQVASIERYYPGVSIVVMDEYDPPDPTTYNVWLDYIKEKPRITYGQKEQGISIGRIEGLKTAKTKYVLISDDDFVFTDKTNISQLLHVIQHTDASIVGAPTDEGFTFQGAIRANQPSGTSLPNLAFYANVFHEYLPCFAGCYVADYFQNFFLVDREEILEGKSWDPHLKFVEHRDVFLQMRNRSLKAIYCDSVVVNHAIKDRSLRHMRKPFKKPLLEYTATKWNSSGVPRKTQDAFLL